MENNSKIRKERKKLIELAKKVYKLLSNKWIHYGFELILLASLFFEFYYNPFNCSENFTSTGNIVAIVVVIWTATVTLSVFYLERIGKKLYGIKIIDILLYDLDYKGVLRIIIEILSIPFILLIVIILNLNITLMIISFEQILLMIYMFLTACIETSKTTVIEIIKKETDESVLGIKKSSINFIMIKKMINEMDYFNEEDRNVLKEILINNVSCGIKNFFLEQKEDGVKNSYSLKRNVNYFCANLTEEILDTGIYKVMSKIDDERILELTVFDLIEEWYMNEQSCIEVKQGILMMFLSRISGKNYEECQRLLAIEMKYQNELRIFCIVYNIYLQGKESEEWRCFLTEQWKKEILFETEEQKLKALEYWEQVHENNECKNTNKDFYKIFRYVFCDENVEDV